MAQILATVLLVPLMIWSIFQPLLYQNAAMTQESIKIALYEIQKQASLQGQYTDELYGKFKQSLSENHGYNPDCIKIVGTESIVERGGDIEVTVTVPKPILSFYDVVSVSSCDRPDSYTPFEYTQTIQSEFIP